MDKLSPGSENAVKMGCLCPVIDNNKGKGAYLSTEGKPVFWFVSNCPLHGNAPKIAPDTELITREE